MTADITPMARALWKQAFNTRWPRGWRCVESNNKRSRYWGITDYDAKLITIYPHRTREQFRATLVHEFAHLFTRGTAHDARFKEVLDFGYLSCNITEVVNEENDGCLVKLHLP